jgi:hypothetical protein
MVGNYKLFCIWWQSLYQLSLAWSFISEVCYPKPCRSSTLLKHMACMPILYQLPIKPKLLHFRKNGPLSDSTRLCKLDCKNYRIPGLMSLIKALWNFTITSGICWWLRSIKNEGWKYSHMSRAGF